MSSSVSGEYTILTSKRINRGAGLDPLKAQKVESPEDPSELETNKHLVSVSLSYGVITRCNAESTRTSGLKCFYI